MSLINDMLKDLDSRRGGPDMTHSTALRGLGLAGTAHGNSRRYLPRFATGSGLLLVAILAWPQITGLFLDSGLQQTTRVAITLPEQASLPAMAPAPRHTTRSGPDVSHTLTPEDLPATAVPQEKTLPVEVAKLPAAGQTPEPVEQPRETPATRHLEITTQPLSREQQLEQAYQLAVRAIQAGDYREAEQKLVDALAFAGSYHRARLLLASLYIRQERIDRAETLLADGLAQHPGHAPYARLYAQLLVTQGRDQEAIGSLLAALPGAVRDADYHALLAGLYQRGGDAAQAIRHYQQALEITPAQGTWWMGLGISREQAGDGDAALDAYRRALQHPLQTTLQQYIQTRIGLLSRQGLQEANITVNTE